MIQPIFFFKHVLIPWISVLGECVISLVLSCHNEDLKRRTKVIAWLQLTVLFVKQRVGNPGGVRAAWPQKRGLSPSQVPLFIRFVSSFAAPPSPPAQPGCPMQTGPARKGTYLFHLRVSLWSWNLPLFYFHGLFPFFFLLATTILDSFFLF